MTATAESGSRLHKLEKVRVFVPLPQVSLGFCVGASLRSWGL